MEEVAQTEGYILQPEYTKEEIELLEMKNRQNGSDDGTEIWSRKC